MRLTDEVADSPRLTTRGEGPGPEARSGVDRPPPAHLVVDPGEHHVVALTEGAVVADERLGDQQQRDAAGAGWTSGDLGQHQVHDVVGEVVLAGGDPHLLPEDPVGPVGLRDRPGRDVGEVGAGLRLRERHRAEEASFEQGRHEGLPQLGRGVVDQQVGVRGREGGVAGGADVRGGEPGSRRHADDRRHLQPAVLLVEPQPQQVGSGVGLHRLLHFRQQVHVLAVPGGLGQVGRPVVRGEEVGGNSFAQAQHPVEGLAGVVAIPLPRRERLDVEPLVEQELKVSPRHDQGHCDPFEGGRGRYGPESSGSGPS